MSQVATCFRCRHEPRGTAKFPLSGTCLIAELTRFEACSALLIVAWSIRLAAIIHADSTRDRRMYRREVLVQPSLDNWRTRGKQGHTVRVYAAETACRQLRVQCHLNDALVNKVLLKKRQRIEERSQPNNTNHKRVLALISRAGQVHLLEHVVDCVPVRRE